MAYRFVFTYEGKAYTYGSLKVRELEALEDLLGVPYMEIRAFSNMKHKLAIMAVFLSRDHSEAEVAEIIDAIDLDAVGPMWDVVEDDLPTEYEDGLPLPEAATSTDT